MSKKQTTLFRSWGNKSQAAPETSIPPEPSAVDTNNVIDLCGSFEDEDDDLLCEAEESIANIKRSDTSRLNGPSTSSDFQYEKQSICDVSFGADGFTQTQMQLPSQSGNIPGFDRSAGKLWIYPTNYPVRDYQFNIVKQALFKNTMVTLPTGLGKTFIAAVVMYNFYRWYPQGKVIFMAPTKPLVAQQIEACYNIMGIPQEHTAEMTGSMGPSKREKAWHNKRVFFLTPQVLTNDLSRGSCPAVDVKCLVIDEAHKALGNHAYCQVVRELIKYTQNFRVLSLSATPGSDIKAVQQVLNNLLISQIEIRTEDSIDIKRYSHERKVEKVVVPLGEELSKVKEKYIYIMDAVVTKLKRVGALYNRDTTSLSKFLILKAREAFRQNPPERLPRNQYGVVEGDFALAMSLYHGYELLQLHGSRSLYTFLDGILTGEKGYGRTRTELMRNAEFNELMKILSGKYRPSTSDTLSQVNAKSTVVGHPKMEKLQGIVVDHFNSHSDAGTRVMIFSQYRDSVQEITHMLDQHKPLIKVMSFIGQASSGKSTKGFTQKEQLKVMKQFREGGYNTLVSTCVGEEGLDIGDVDLIVCFDAHKSPIRLVQRMGRTGRKREGRIVMLVTQGKEEQIYNQSQYSKRSIHKAILNGAKSLHFYQHSSRMVPEGLNPACHKMHITVKENFKPTKKLTSGKNSNQNKISTMMNEVSSKKEESDVVITLEEYRELEPWLVPECDIPKLPHIDLCCLKKDSVPQQEADGKFFSLSEWSPWQTTLQETKLIDHSCKTKHFVEIMEFVHLQQSLDPGDDPYGLEMAAYFNEEDVVQTDKNRRNSILNFCVTGQNKKTEEYSKKTKDKRSRVRRSDKLPNFDFLDEKIDEGSDEDLPAFNIISVEQDKPSEKREKSKESHKVVLSDVDESDLDHDSNKIVRSPLVEKSENLKKSIKSKAKMLEKKMVVEKNRKRKKSRHGSGNTSMISWTADNDFNDFEDNGNVVAVCHSKILRKSSEELGDNVPESVSDLNVPDVDFNNADEVDGVVNSVIQTETSKPSGLIRIRTPPLVEDAVKLCQDLDKEMQNVSGASIDLLTLIDEWHNENKEGKYIVYPSDVPNLYTPGKPFNMKRRSLETCKTSIPVEHESVDNDVRYSYKIETYIENLNVSEPLSKTVKDGSKGRLDFISGISSKVFKTPSAADKNNTKNKKSLTDSENYIKYSKNLLVNKLSIENENSVMDVDSDNEIMATGTFNLAADDIFSDDEIVDQSVIDFCDKSVEEICVSSKEYEAVLQINERNISPTFQMKPASCKGRIQNSSKSKDTLKDGSSEFVPVMNHEHEDIVNDSGESIGNVNEKVPFSSGAKFDSFDDLDDDLLVNVKTPVIANKPHETSTQITFTQAINFVDSSLHTSGSESCNEHDTIEDKSKNSFSVINSAVAISRNVKNVAKLKSSDFADKNVECVEDNSNPNYLNDSEDSSIPGMVKKKIITKKNVSKKPDAIEESSREEVNGMHSTRTEKTDVITARNDNNVISRKESTSSDEDLQLPEFDLDFDFDEDIIPPSPNNQVSSQTSGSNRLSQAFSFSNRLSQSRCLPFEDSVSIEKDDGVEDRTDKDNDNLYKMNKQSKVKKCLKLNEYNANDDECNQIAEEESQSILGDAPIRKLTLNKDRKKCNSNKALHTLNTIEENIEKYSEGVDEIGEKDILKKNEQSEKVCATINEEFESSFALIGEDFDDWIDSGAQAHDESCNMPEAITLGDKCCNSGPKIDLSHSNSEPESEMKLINNRFSSIKKSIAPVATVSPFNSSQDFSIIKPSQKRNSDSTTGKYKNETVRKSMFQIDDLSPDAFEDSFDFSCEMLVGKSTPKSCLKNCDVIRGTSTPLVGPSKHIQNVTPFKVADCTLEHTKQTSYQTPSSLSKAEYVTDNDDSFIVRRKKKVQILDSPFSQRQCGNEKSKGSNSDSHSVSFQSNEAEIDADDDVDDSALLHNNDYFQKKTKLLITSSSDEDFESSIIKVKKNVVKAMATNIKNKSKPVRKKSNPFLHEEAELSDDGDHDASSDEEEGSDLDVYEGSFIADSQSAQAMDNTDIHAVYLKSVKSPPVAARGGYKLQFNHRTDIDVFSQVPEPDYSEYMEDSFCVHSEEEDDWLLEEVAEEPDETREVTMMQNSALYSGRKKRRKGVHAFQTSRQRAIQAGRMKALDEIKAKLAGKSKKTDFKRPMKSSSSDDSVINKPAPKRSRIQRLDESTSDEDGDNVIHTGIATPDVNPKTVQNKKARFLMSSDSEIDDDFMVERSLCKSNISKKSNEVKPHDSIARTNSGVPNAERMKMERLKRQKEKQTEYKRRMVEKALSEKNSSPPENLTKIRELSKSNKIDELRGIDPDMKTNSNNNVSSNNRVVGKPVILVDSKEISGAQDIVSDLRFKYDIKVSAAQLPGCDFVVSNRMAVERKQWSEFSNGANRSKLIERLQHLGELYDRPCLVVEKDRVKPGEEKSARPVHWTKYIDRTIALLLRSDVKVLYSDSMSETAEILADLCSLEQRKNMGINVPVDLNDEKLNLMKFFSSIPKLSYVHALNLCDGFQSLSEFLRSCAAVIEVKGKMTKNRALDVVSFIKRDFDSNMLPSHK